MVIEDKYIDFVHKKLNSFDNNLKFTVDLFDKETPHFLDLELSPDGCLFSVKIQTLDFMLILTAMYLGPIAFHGFVVWCHVHTLFVNQIN